MIGELAALAAALCWTASAVFYRNALIKAKPFSANTTRCLGISLIFIIFLFLTGKFRVLAAMPVKVLLFGFASGVIGLGLGDTLYMFSLENLGVARAVPITCIYPLFNLLWAVLLNGEKIALPVAVGAVLIVLGVWLLSIEKKFSVETKGRIPVKGVIFALVAAFAWSISILLVNMAVKISSNIEHVFAVNALRIWASAIFLLILSPILDRNFEFLKVNMRVLAALLVGGIIAIGVGWFLLTLSFLYIPESQAVPISSTTPLFSTLFGIAFLHEKVTLKVFLGSILIVFGIFLIFTV